MNRRPWLALLVLVIATAAAGIFSLATYRSMSLLDTARSLDRPDVGQVRAWMSVRYVAGLYKVAEHDLAQRLAIAPARVSVPFREIIKDTGETRVAVMRRVQIALDALLPPESRVVTVVPAPSDADESATEAAFASWILSYGYPVMALSLILGAIGVPLPSSFTVILVGSLAAHGEVRLDSALLAATLASVIGDGLGYLLGLRLGEPLIRRHGRWLGITNARQAQASRWLQAWGGLTIILSRSLVSFLSSAVNLLSGSIGYRPGHFLFFSLIGRLIWSAGYLGMGYLAAIGINSGSGMMGNLSGLLLSLLLASYAITVLLRQWRGLAN
ncbi:MAG: VTT domain-containing protein [Burkholderiaceae bacterium]